MQQVVNMEEDKLKFGHFYEIKHPYCTMELENKPPAGSWGLVVLGGFTETKTERDTEVDSAAQKALTIVQVLKGV